MAGRNLGVYCSWSRWGGWGYSNASGVFSKVAQVSDMLLSRLNIQSIATSTREPAAKPTNIHNPRSQVHHCISAHPIWKSASSVRPPSGLHHALAMGSSSRSPKCPLPTTSHCYAKPSIKYGSSNTTCVPHTPLPTLVLEMTNSTDHNVARGLRPSTHTHA